MKKLLVICSILLFFSTIFAQQDSASVEFRVITSNFENIDSIFLTGNSVKLGNWNPRAIALQQIDDSTFHKNILFPLNTNLEYKFTKGSWETEALNKDETIQANHTLTVIKDTSITYSISKWKDEDPQMLNGQITGRVEYITNIKSHDKLLLRDLIVWLPPGYYENTNIYYPVLYMHDGQNIIDPKTSFLGTDWQIDETADSLIRKNEIEPIIIVGISNTANRTSEYSENDTGYAYIDFLVNDVKPMIDKKYKTKRGREHTAVAGSSMGGLISFMIAWEHPDVFMKAACLSPAFKISRFNFVDNVVSYTGEKKDILFYIDNGTVELEDSLQTGVDEMLSALNMQNYKEGNDFVFYKDEGASHTEADWASRSWRFLKLFFGKEK